MEPCNHTKLMNYIIGMCKKHKDWITVLDDLGYELQIIEQQMRTSSDEVVKPDVVAVSNKLLHSLVFECKGGATVETEQLKKYLNLTADDLLRWVTVFSPKDLKLDVCISDLEENHPLIADLCKRFAMITFGKERVFMTGEARLTELNDAFREPIGLEGKIPPLSYYPFSDNDENSFIAPFVLRGLVSVAIKNAKGGPSVLDESAITRDELVKLIFNPIFDALSRDHQGRLRERIKEVIKWIMAKEDMKDALGIIEQHAGYKIGRPLDKFVEEAAKFMKFLETQRPLSEFMNTDPALD